MVSAFLIVVLLLAHMVGDFFLQSNWAATNKHHSWRALGLHVATYSTFLAAATVVVAPVGLLPVLAFVAVNGVAHFVIDAVTSRLTTAFWKRAVVLAAGGPANLRNVFHVIGTDQFLHAAILVVTATLWLQR